jgi:hypothetical protein
MNMCPGAAEPLVQPQEQGQQVVGAIARLTPYRVASETHVRPTGRCDVGEKVVGRGIVGGAQVLDGAAYIFPWQSPGSLIRSLLRG